jgi:hypothetical protein
MSVALSFIIPVRHPDNARDWRLVKRNLTQTIASIAAQRSDAWKAVIIANHGADLPQLPSGFSVKWVDFPPNPLYEQGTADEEAFRDALRIDKGRRVLAGMFHAGATNFFMVVDDDDFVNRKLTSFVEEKPGSNGWYISQGYFWETQGKFLYYSSKFSQICGTSHIVRSDLYRIPPKMSEASDDYVREMLGSHIMIEHILAERGTPLEPLPFPGAIYRIGHPGSHGNSRGLFGQLFRSRNPLRFLPQIARLRLATKSVKRNFFGSATL